jgi:hypothetical protein
MEQHILGSHDASMLSNSLACGSFGAVGALAASTSWVPSSDFSSHGGLCVGSHLDLNSLNSSVHGNGSVHANNGSSVHGNGSVHGNNGSIHGSGAAAAALAAGARTMGAFGGAGSGALVADALRRDAADPGRQPTSVEDIIG